MSYEGPTGRWVFIDGYDALGTGGQVKELEALSLEPTIEETSAVNDTRTRRSPTGHIDDGRLRMLAWVSDDTFALLDQLCYAFSATGRVVCWGETAANEGTECWCGLAFEGMTKKLVPGKELTKAEVELAFTNGALFSRVLYPLTVTAGATFNTEATSVNNGTRGAAIVVDTSSVANPSVITTTTAHGFLTGDTVLIAGHVGSTPAIDGSHTVTVTGTTTFTIPVNVTVGGTGGTATRTSTRNGGYVWQQVTDLTLGGYTSYDGSVKHSVDNITFAVLASFTAVTASPDAERVAVTGAINRYTAYYGAYTGAGAAQSVTVMAALSRKEL